MSSVTEVCRVCKESNEYEVGSLCYVARCCTACFPSGWEHTTGYRLYIVDGPDYGVYDYESREFFSFVELVSKACKHNPRISVAAYVMLKGEWVRL